MSCDKCPDTASVCVMQLAAVCIQEESACLEWTHITSREHVCQACIGVIKAETGLDNYAEFERRWNPDCLYPATTLTYITERLLPYWLQCKAHGIFEPNHILFSSVRVASFANFSESVLKVF